MSEEAEGRKFGNWSGLLPEHREGGRAEKGGGSIFFFFPLEEEKPVSAFQQTEQQ